MAHALREHARSWTARASTRLLREITARCASLPFDYQSPTLIPYERTALDERDLLYHAFVYLRWACGGPPPAFSRYSPG